MDSGSAKNQDNNQTKEPPGDDVPRPPEESKAAPAAAAAAPEPPPPAPPSERLQEHTNGSPEAGGGRNPCAPAAVAAEAASAAQQDGTGIAAPSPRGSAVGKPPLPPRAAPSRRGSASVKPPLPPIAASISRAGEPKPAGGKPPLPHRAVPASTLKSKGKKPMSHAEVVESGMAVRVKWREMREGRRGMAEEFNELLEESKKAMPEQGTATQQKKQFLDRVGISDLNSRVMNPAVNYETIPIAGIPLHYGLLEMVAGQGLEFNANALNLQRVYSEFRPVLGDGECFYRSFIFNYLEQVLDRQDTHEERRILAAAEEVAMQHARLGWADEFSRSHKAFKNLINKVKGWKISRRHVPTSNSYCKRKLLQYFNSYHGRNDIYAFLRFVAAIWMCSHSEEFTPLIQPEIEEGGYTTLTDWCLVEVIQQKVMTDHIQITALLRALEVSLRVEDLLQGFGDDLHTVQGSQDHEVPRVILLYTNNNHYDIIYPDPNAAVSQGSDNVEIPPANSPSQDRGGSCTGEKPGEEQIAQVESSPTGENPNQHTEQGGQISADAGSRFLTDLPEDVFLEIFFRLPLDAIRRFRRVCKLWRRLLSSTRFKRNHARHWLTPTPVFVFQPGAPYELQILGIDIAAREARSLLHLVESVNSEDGFDVNICGSCDGILLLSHGNDLCICNPLTQRWGRLPPIHLANRILSFYRWSSGSSDDKELYLLYKTECQGLDGSFFISTLSTQEFRPKALGRPIMPGSPPELNSAIQKLCGPKEAPATLIKGKIYWLLPSYSFQTSRNFLVGFDIEKEQFFFLHTPEVERLYAYQVFEVSGSLGMAVWNETMTSLNIWLLRCEAGMEVWTCPYKIHLPVVDIDDNQALQQFVEPILYFVSQEMDFLIWCPSTLLQGNSTGAIVQRYGHWNNWRMTVPHLHRESLEEHSSLSMGSHSLPPFFRFVEM